MKAKIIPALTKTILTKTKIIPTKAKILLRYYQGKIEAKAETKAKTLSRIKQCEIKQEDSFGDSFENIKEEEESEDKYKETSMLSLLSSNNIGQRGRSTSSVESKICQGM